MHKLRTALFAVAAIALLAPSPGVAQQPKKPDAGSAAAAANIADFFGKVGDQIFEDCIFDLSQEQIEVQQALIQAYVKQGATSVVARRLAVKQIHPPKLTKDCERIRGMPGAARPGPMAVAPMQPPAKAAKPEPWKATPEPAGPAVALAQKATLRQWDCAPGVDFVTIHRNGFQRKLTGGEICNPFQDVVKPVPASAPTFRFGYTIKTGRLFIITEDARSNGQTVAWAISGREVCRNNPDPDCFAARAVGPLPPGEYTFASDAKHRLNWGPKTKRMVAGIYLKKLWNKERFTPAQTSAILARGNIAIHVRLKGEMSEACLGLEPKGWAYVSSLIKDGRATGVNVYIDEPHPQIAEAAPVVVASSFSLTSLFKQ
jgi:hypothetical protein